MKIAKININGEKFGNGGLIPTKYTCGGKDVNPPLRIKNLPAKAKSLVVIFEDSLLYGLEAVHWLMFNIPAKNRINEDEKEGEVGFNRFNKNSYIGPCPDQSAHRYLFRVYVLDDFLEFKHLNVTRYDVEEGIKYHLIGYGELEAIGNPKTEFSAKYHLNQRMDFRPKLLIVYLWYYKAANWQEIVK